MTDDEILKKADRIVTALEHATADQTVNELEIMADALGPDRAGARAWFGSASNASLPSRTTADKP